MIKANVTIRNKLQTKFYARMSNAQRFDRLRQLCRLRMPSNQQYTIMEFGVDKHLKQLFNIFVALDQPKAEKYGFIQWQVELLSACCFAVSEFAVPNSAASEALADAAGQALADAEQ